MTEGDADVRSGVAARLLSQAAASGANRPCECEELDPRSKPEAICIVVIGINKKRASTCDGAVARNADYGTDSEKCGMRTDSERIRHREKDERVLTNAGPSRGHIESFRSRTDAERGIAPPLFLMDVEMSVLAAAAAAAVVSVVADVVAREDLRRRRCRERHVPDGPSGGDRTTPAIGLSQPSHSPLHSRLQRRAALFLPPFQADLLIASSSRSNAFILASWRRPTR